MTNGTVDGYNAKVVRCSMGAVVRQRVQLLETSSAALPALLRGFRVFATELRGAVTSTALAPRLTGRDALVFGNEKRGVSREVLQLAHERLEGKRLMY